MTGITQEYFSSFSTIEKEDFFGNNAAAFYRI